MAMSSVQRQTLFFSLVSLPLMISLHCVHDKVKFLRVPYFVVESQAFDSRDWSISNIDLSHLSPGPPRVPLTIAS